MHIHVDEHANVQRLIEEEDVGGAPDERVDVALRLHERHVEARQVDAAKRVDEIVDNLGVHLTYVTKHTILCDRVSTNHTLDAFGPLWARVPTDTLPKRHVEARQVDNTKWADENVDNLGLHLICEDKSHVKDSRSHRPNAFGILQIAKITID